MQHSPDKAQPYPAQEHSAGELVKQLSEQVSLLVRQEMRLARLEMTRKGKQGGAGLGMLGGGGLLALYGLGCLLASAIVAISGVVSAWLAALIVGAALLAAAGVAALTGKARLSRATPPMPEEMADSVKADVAEIRERARR